RRCPNTMRGGGVLEIRPFYEAEDFGDALTPELRAKEQELRARSAKR
ncbi:MAG: YciI family protein, partial [Gemmatimonadaceae bacterium]|nr:YciI family protein [Gemmatimonadaceae bacterium]